MIAIVPYEPWHREKLEVRSEQALDLIAFSQSADRIAALGPAFSIIEQDDAGQVKNILVCAGLAETAPGCASAWAAISAKVRSRDWPTIIRAIRAVIEGSGYQRIDMLARADWPVARRFAEWLGFTEQAVVYVRANPAREA